MSLTGFSGKGEAGFSFGLSAGFAGMMVVFDWGRDGILPASFRLVWVIGLVTMVTGFDWAKADVTATTGVGVGFTITAADFFSRATSRSCAKVRNLLVLISFVLEVIVTSIARRLGHRTIVFNYS